MKKGKIVLETVAKRNGVSPDEVEAEIQAAIKEAMEVCRKNNDNKAMEMWHTITNGTGHCTASELIEFLAAYAAED